MIRHKIMIAGTANPHVPAYLRGAGRNVSMLEVVAISDFDSRRRAEVKAMLGDRDIPLYSDYLQMFDRHPEAEAVMIGSDNIDHLAMFREAIRRHLHIYMMKVISMDEAECQEMIRLAEHYPQAIACELELHFNPQFIHARKLIQDGAIGDIQSIYLTNVSQSPCNYFPNWGDPLLSYGKRIPIHPGDEVFRGGAITDHPHPFDLIRWMTGREFKTVSAVSAPNQRKHLAVEDHAAITGRLDDGTPYFINPSYSNLEEKVATRRLLWPKSLECNLKVTGTKGYVSADFFDRHSLLVGKNWVSPDRLIVDGVPGIPADPDCSLAGSFVAVIEGRREKPETSLNESYQAVRVMNAAYESIYRNQEIVLS